MGSLEIPLVGSFNTGQLPREGCVKVVSERVKSCVELKGVIKWVSFRLRGVAPLPLSHS